MQINLKKYCTYKLKQKEQKLITCQMEMIRKIMRKNFVKKTTVKHQYYKNIITEYEISHFKQHNYFYIDLDKIIKCTVKFWKTFPLLK